MDLTTQGILSLFQTTKAERSTFIADIMERIENDTADAIIKVHLQLKGMEEIVKKLTTNENYKDHLINAAEKYGKKFMAFNAEFNMKERGDYDFTYCGDDELLEFYTQQDKLKYLIKEREDFLKKVPVKGLEKVTAEGEVITLFPPSKTSTTTVAVTLK